MTNENANKLESNLEISKKITEDLFGKNNELKPLLEKTTSKSESRQTELLEANKSNVLLKEGLDAFDVANKRFKEKIDKTIWK